MSVLLVNMCLKNILILFLEFFTITQSLLTLFDDCRFRLVYVWWNEFLGSVSKDYFMQKNIYHELQRWSSSIGHDMNMSNNIFRKSSQPTLKELMWAICMLFADSGIYPMLFEANFGISNIFIVNYNSHRKSTERIHLYCLSHSLERLTASQSIMSDQI